MPTALIIGTGCGLASALLFYSAARGGVLLKLALFLLTPLPSLIAGIAWNWTAALAAGITGALVMAAAAGPAFGIGFFLAVGGPAILLSYLADLARPTANGGPVQWYPAGHMLAALAAYAGAFPVLIAPLFGGSYTVLKPDLLAFMTALGERLEKSLGGRHLSPEELESWTLLLIDAIPATIAGYLVIIWALNLYLAGRIARASGRLHRPWPDLHALDFPPWAWLLLALAIVASMTTGVPRMAGTSYSGAMLVAFALMGLSVLHAIMRGRVPWLLWLAYAALINPAGPYALVVLALIGVAEPLLGLRRRLLKQPPPPDPPIA